MIHTARFDRSKELQQYLNANGIQTRPFWVPMHRLPAFANDIYYHFSDVSEDIYANSLSLSCSTNIADEEIEKVICNIKNFYDR
ncbi:DegT/DnrJ/EryC1/StrS family aminotransferase [Chitinophaga agri]|uniref:DegT/DnrJ/EryC1/StrS aminotransferase family protein n=1 Tax=Chitinophaga agri TaxID=2703787 RepID=A0A6B9Z7L8_9BACT|nr:DegT/DnrJ/EryC1/StrS family aminotransferase [Chitinophaga agri]QHS58232.1 hypothetical protein GWR21_01070 [Chitinophaga agri]